MDAAIFHWVLAHRIPALDSSVILVSHAGALTWLTIGFLLALLHRRQTGTWAGLYQAAQAIGLAVLLADVIGKPFIDRPRPYVQFPDIHVLIALKQNASFPSTHAAAVFAAAFAYARLFTSSAPLLWVFACLVAASRVYVGVHYPSDVLAGAAVGLASAAFVVAGTQWRTKDQELRTKD